MTAIQRIKYFTFLDNELSKSEFHSHLIVEPLLNSHFYRPLIVSLTSQVMFLKVSGTFLEGSDPLILCMWHLVLSISVLNQWFLRHNAETQHPFLYLLLPSSSKFCFSKVTGYVSLYQEELNRSYSEMNSSSSSFPKIQKFAYP